METSIIHILGPGGAGKSTAGELLAKNLGIPFIDLDQIFFNKQGHIEKFIAEHGYSTYARENVCNYLKLITAHKELLVVTLSSGFMTYPLDAEPSYNKIITAIKSHPLSILLLPSYEIEECVEILVSRQLGRVYLSSNRMIEENKARKRFPLFMSLKCRHFQSNIHPIELADRLTKFVMASSHYNTDQANKSFI